MGKPGPDAPVILTCNFALTVTLVERTLRGLDAWLKGRPHPNPPRRRGQE